MHLSLRTLPSLMNDHTALSQPRASACARELLLPRELAALHVNLVDQSCVVPPGVRFLRGASVAPCIF